MKLHATCSLRDEGKEPLIPPLIKRRQTFTLGYLGPTFGGREGIPIPVRVPCADLLLDGGEM
jgi:hypothetical protein